MNIHYKLFPHQKALLTTNENMVYLRAGRGSGKSYIASLMAVIALLEGKRVICLGQNYKQVCEVLMSECINRLYEILKPEDFNVHKGMMKITYKRGVIYFASYETPDAIRGYTEISLAILDEAALADPEIMTVLPFCMRGQNIVPKIVMISTPRSMNWLTRFVRDNNVKTLVATTKDNKFISEEQIALMRKSCLSETAWQREFFGIEVDDDNSGVLFTHELLDPAPLYGHCISIGVDCSGLGRDNNCIVVRQGNKVIKIIRKVIASAKDLYSEIKSIVKEYGASNFSSISLDMAYGQALYELLMDTDLKSLTYLIPFGGGAEDPAYANKRAEMYVNAKRYIAEHGISGLDEDLTNELMATKYELNAHDKVQLIKKDDIKMAIGRSPDSGDAFALTFAMPDMPRGVISDRRNRQQMYMG